MNTALVLFEHNQIGTRELEDMIATAHNNFSPNIVLGDFLSNNREQCNIPVICDAIYVIKGCLHNL